MLKVHRLERTQSDLPDALELALTHNRYQENSGLSARLPEQSLPNVSKVQRAGTHQWHRSRR